MMLAMPRAETDPALATVLRRLRKADGRSQERLAADAGITSSALQRIELEQASPSWVTVVRIAEALDVTMVELSAAVEAERC